MSDTSERAVTALSDFLLARDFPRGGSLRPWSSDIWRYRCMAAAVLNGEEWSLRKAWPIADRFQPLAEVCDEVPR